MLNGRYEFIDGIYYYKNNEYHREDGPAIEYNDGSKYWYKEGKLHREDVPSIESYGGVKYWYKEGKVHRLDGPAIEWQNGDKWWYIEGKRIFCNSQEEFERKINLLYFW